jgi:signal transduction histidine kinase
MAAQIAQFQRTWQRWLNGARAALGLACLATEVSSAGFRFAGMTVLSAAFLAYAVAVFLRGDRSDKPGPNLLRLCADAVFFLIFSAYGADQGAWLASVFYCYLLLAAVVGHNWADVFIVVGVCIAYFGLARSPDKDFLRRLVLLAGLLACALAYQKRKLQERLDRAARNEQHLRAEAARAAEAARERIAGDFHDGPLQNVISLQIRLEILRHLLERDRDEGLRELTELQELAKAIVAELRSFLRTMRPPPVEGADLRVSLRRVVEDFQKDTGIPVRFGEAEAPLMAPSETGIEVLQIVREALYNVHKHAQAGRVAVSIERVGKNLEVEVDDNGAGFPFSGSFTLEELEILRIGPRSIRRRVRGLGGDLLIESRPGQGAGLKIRVPA